MRKKLVIPRPPSERFLEPKEVRRLLQATKDPELHLAFSLAYLFGLRVGEVADLKASDIDLRHGKIWVRTLKRGRNGPGRPVPYWRRGPERRPPVPVPILGPRARAAVEEALQRGKATASGYIFPGRTGGTPRDRLWFQVRYRNLADRLGLPRGSTFHSLRHSFGTVVARHERNPFAVRDALRHTSVASCDRYVHAAGPRDPEGLGKALEGA